MYITVRSLLTVFVLERLFAENVHHLVVVHSPAPATASDDPYARFIVVFSPTAHGVGANNSHNLMVEAFFFKKNGMIALLVS